MADELDRGILSAKEKGTSDSLIVGFSERNLIVQRPHVTKLSRSELEDQYLRLLDYNVELKKHCNKQDEKIKRLATKLLHVVAQKKREFPLSARHDAELQMTINQQQQHITNLEQANQQLIERITVLRKQLTEHSTLHSAVHCNYPGSLHSSRSPSRHTAAALRPQTRISSANSQNLFHSEVSSEPVPPNEDTEGHKAQCPVRGMVHAQHPPLSENVERDQELEQLHVDVALLQQEMERQQQVSNVRISELEEELVNTNTLLQKQKVEDNVELIQLKRSLQQSTNQIKERDARIDSLEKEQSKLEEMLQQAHKHTDELRALLSAESKRVADLQEELKKMQQNILRPETEAHIKELEREVEVLKQTNIQLTESLKSREAADGEKKIKSKISDMVQKEIQEKLEKTKQLQEQERAELAELMAANDELQAKYNEIVSKHDELEKRLKVTLENPITAQLQNVVPDASPLKELFRLQNILPDASSVKEVSKQETNEKTQAAEKQTREQQTDSMLQTEDNKRPAESKSNSEKETQDPSAENSSNNPTSSFSRRNEWLSYFSQSKSVISDDKMAPSATVDFKGTCLCGTLSVRLPKGFCLCTRNERPSVLGRRFLQKTVDVEAQDSSTKEVNSSSHTEKDTTDVSDTSFMDVATSEQQSSSAKQNEDGNKENKKTAPEIPTQMDQRMEDELYRLTSVQGIGITDDTTAPLPGEDKEALAERLKLSHDLQTCRELLRVQHGLTSLYKKEVGILSDKLRRKNTGPGSQIAQKEMKDLRKLSKQEVTTEEQRKNTDIVIESVPDVGQAGFFQIHMQNLELTPEGIAALEQAAPGDPRLFLTWTFFDKEHSYTPVKKAAPVTELGSSSVHRVIINEEFLKYLSKESCTIQAHAAVDDISTTIATGALCFSELLTKPSNRIHTTVSLRLLDQQNKDSFGILHCWFHLSCAYEVAQKMKQIANTQETEKPKHKIPVPVPRKTKTSERVKERVKVVSRTGLVS